MCQLLVGFLPGATAEMDGVFSKSTAGYRNAVFIVAGS